MILVTWNVWFDPWSQSARYAALLDEALACRPDVIALQEVTQPLVARIDAHPQLSTWWRSETRAERDPRTYDAVLLSRRRPDESGRFELPTRQGRALITARLGALTLGTVHLESLRPSAAFRARQLHLIAEHLKERESALFMGDMNFADGDSEIDALPDDWRDAWVELHGDDTGYTVDTQINEMRQQSKDGRTHRARYDRAFLRSSAWSLRRVERLGLNPLPDDPLTFPSDHFGLVIELSDDG